MRCTRDLHVALTPGLKGANVRPRRQSTNPLFALSGGAGSTAMLSMLHERGYWATSEGEVRDKTKGQKEIVWPKAWAAHVDFSAVTGLAPQTERLREMAEGMGMTFIALKAEDAFDPTLVRRIRAEAGLPAEEGEGEGVALSVNLADSGESAK